MGKVTTEVRGVVSTPREHRRCVRRRDGTELCEDVSPLGEQDASTQTERSLRVGSRRCRCGRCGRHFGGLTAFDAHQRLDDAGDVLCIYPGSLGMVVTVDGMGGWWSMPGPDAALTERR